MYIRLDVFSQQRCLHHLAPLLIFDLQVKTEVFKECVVQTDIFNVRVLDARTFTNLKTMVFVSVVFHFED